MPERQANGTFIALLEKLRQRLGLNLRLRGNKILVGTGGHKTSLNIVQVDLITSQNLKACIKHITDLGTDHIMLTPRISKELLRKLRVAGINVIDYSGKLFIKHEGIYIFSDEVCSASRQVKKSLGISFNQSGVKIIFACLCLPNLINENFRTIAELTHTSLGSVSRVLDDLKKLGYLVKKNNRERSLAKNDELLNRWCIAYVEILRPKLTVHRYHCDDPYWWQQIDISHFKGVWGGEVAAALITKNLKPETVTIYTKASLAKLQLMKKLRRDPNGEIEILDQFWDFKFSEQDEAIAPYILVYADLISTGDDRNDEIATEIKNHYISPIFHKT